MSKSHHRTKTLKQSTTLKLPSSNIVSRNSVKPSAVKSKNIIYGPFTDVEPNAESEEFFIHIENQNAFVHFPKVEREIEISHWGNIAFEEHFWLEHSGAKLKGEFSRVDYSPHRPGASYRELKASLPKGASDLYYRDIIGNISTSSTRETEDTLEMYIDTRFPIMPGWKTQWYQGYNLPLERYVSKSLDSGKYVIEVPVQQPYRVASTKELVIKVILPPGATDVEVGAGTHVKKRMEERRTYLDVPWAPRPVVVLEFENLVRPESDAKLRITYSLSTLTLLTKPIVSFLLVLVVFFTVIFASQADLAIGDGASRKKLKSL